MKCKIIGCDRDATYKGKQLCQKHYFRIMRNGDTELLLEKKKRLLGYSRKYRVTMPGKGYQRIYEPNHPLKDHLGYVSEHRFVIYKKYGEVLPNCEICGKETNWETCHIDHIDRDVTNNHESNLRPLCAGCNTWRDRPPEHTLNNRIAITFNGITQTAHEWSRHPDVNVTGHTIRRRLKEGASFEEALFGDKKTHNGKPFIDNRIRKTEFKHQRKNAIALTINGVTQTASEWSRHPDCKVSQEGIVYRKKHGWNDFDCVFKPSKNLLTKN